MALNLDPSSSDISVQLIAKVLGTGWQAWATGGSAAGAGGVLASMFQTVNTALLTLAAGVMLYSHAMGATDLARTGESKVNTWTFLRQAVAMMMLAPVPWASGLNILQVLVMLVTGWSIGLANAVWSSGVSYVASNGGSIQPASNIYPIDPSVMKGILESSVIAQGLANEGYTVTPYSKPTYGWNIVGKGPQNGIVFGYQVTGSAGSLPPDALGLVSLQCAPSLCLAVQSGIQSATSDLKQIAANAASWSKSGADGTTLTPGVFSKADGVYSAAIQSALTANASQQNQNSQTKLNQFSQTASQDGWASAGVFFFQLSDFNKDASTQSISISYKDANAQELNGLMSDSITNALALVDQYAANESSSLASGGTLAAAGAGSAAGGTCPSWRDGIWNSTTCMLSTPLMLVNNRIINGVTGGSTSLLGGTGVDAIAGIQTTCNEGIDIIEQSLGTFVGITGTISGIKAVAKGEANAGDSIPIIGGLVGGAVSFASGFASGALTEIKDVAPFVWTTAFGALALLSVGAYYLPILPALIFGFGVIGWMILVLEMLIGAPLWAFSHVLPEGDGLMGSSARAAYFHALDIFARPTLLIFGLFLTILTMNAAVSFMAAGLQIAFASEMQGKIVGVFSALAELVIIMGAIYVATNKSVHLISTVPKTVMRWLGQSMGVDSGEIETERQVNMVGGAKFGTGSRNIGGSLANAARESQRDAKLKAGQAASAAASSAEQESASANTKQSSQSSVTPEAGSGSQQSAGATQQTSNQQSNDTQNESPTRE